MIITRERSLHKFTNVSKRLTARGLPRVLVADIETFPILAYVWGLFKQNISLAQIKEDWSMMSFAAKWLEEPEMFYLDNRKRKDPKDDSAQLEALYKILAVTDFVVAHNGQRFDVPKIKARLVQAGYDPIRPIKVVDTLLLNRSIGFTSQKLEYVAGVVGNEEKDDHKNFPGWSLWLGCMDHNIEAWKECELYNPQDVIALEETYLKNRGWYSGGPNFAVYADHVDGAHNCQNCGSADTVKQKTPYRTQVGIYEQFLCTNCGAFNRGRQLIASKEERSHILIAGS